MMLQTRSEREARLIWKLCSQSQWNYERAKKELVDGEWVGENRLGILLMKIRDELRAAGGSDDEQFPSASIPRL
jgi:hypothetical protein